MVRSKLAAAILSASLALPGLASALGVGEYTLKSYLNQPLELEIQLVQTKDLSTEEVIAALATQDDFARAGVDRLFFLTDLRFEIRQGADGALTVVARTSKPVTEPFLNFLMEVQWPQGRLLREYTILLDPPIYKAGAAATATAAPVIAAPAPVVVAPAPAPVPAYTPPPPPPPPPPAPVASDLPPPPSAASRSPARPTPAAPEPQSAGADAGAGEYRVQGSDTMWEIAARHRSSGTSVQQTMMAIQRANPDAFIQGNVNLVKRGYVLRIPGDAESQAVSTSEASSQLASQTQAWREMLDQRQASLPTDAAQLQAGGAARPAAAGKKGTGSGEVTLVAPNAAGGTKASGGKEPALQNQLAIAEEGLDKAARENKELASRLADLDKQVKGSEKLLAMKNDEIAGLQTELNKLRKAGPAAPAVAEPVPAPDAAAVEQVPAEAQPATEPEVAAAQPEKPKKEIKKDKPKKQVKSEKSGGSMLVPILGVLALLGAGGAGFWFWRRRQAAATGTAVIPEEDVHDAQVADDLAQLQDLNLLGDADDDAGSVAGAAAGSDSESTDPLGEADMYMAYGRFQHAADILYAALQREPERADLRVKLAEVYAEMGDNDSARTHASQAAESGNATIRGQADAILARVGGAAPVLAQADEALPSLDDLALEFSGGTDSHQAVASDFDDLAQAEPEESLDFSLDDSAFADDATADMSSTAVRAKHDDLADEFSLDDADMGDFSLADEKPAEVAAGDDFSLDDDLSLDSDFSLDEVAAEPAAPAGSADDLSLDSDLDFALDDVAAAEELPSLEDDFAAVEASDAASALPELNDDDVTAVQPAVQDLDLESELADLQSDLSGEGMGAADETGGDDFDFLADSDENATKLDLARAYIDMGDAEGARDILNEVVADGTDAQKSEARGLLGQIG